MKCHAVQRRLLSLEDPTRPPAELQDHLGRCSPCQEWQRRLLQLERHVPLLPVPQSTGRAYCIQKLLAEGAGQAAGDKAGIHERPATTRGAWLSSSILQLRSSLHTVRSSRQWRAPAAVAAAVLLVVIGGWALWGTHQGPEPTASKAPAPDPLLASLLKHDLRLAEAENLSERLEALAGLADDLQGEIRALAHAAAAEDLSKLAGLYQRVIQNGVVPRAQELPENQRQQVLGPIAIQLAQAGTDAEGLAQQLPADKAESLRKLASAAQEGDDQLRVLLRSENKTTRKPSRPWDDHQLVKSGW